MWCPKCELGCNNECLAIDLLKRHQILTGDANYSEAGALFKSDDMRKKRLEVHAMSNAIAKRKSNGPSIGRPGGGGGIGGGGFPKP